MAKHIKDLIRIPIKHIRDKAKARYKKDSKCAICGITEDLDFHHYNTLTPLFERWCRVNKIVIKSDEDVLDIRERFIFEHEKELYEDTVTLCHQHHMALHAVYGKNPSLGTASKQPQWVEKQKEKYEARKLAS